MEDEKQQFDDQEAEAILRLAAQKSGLGGMSRDQLLAAAAEAGIAPEAVEAAEREYRKDVEHRRQRNAFERYRRSEFWTHFGSYLLVNLFLFGIDIISDGKLEWAFYPVLGWGIGLGIHAWITYFPGGESDREFARWKRREARRAAGLDDDELHGIIIGIHAHRPDIRSEKLQAAKELRERTRLSSAEAKAAIDEYIEETQ